MKWILFLGLLFLPCSHSSEDTEPVWKTGKGRVKIKPEYESCKKEDLSSLEKIKPSGENTTATFCFSCSIKKIFGFGELKETAQAMQSKTFMDKLQKRVIGQIKSKIFQTKMLRACVTEDPYWFRWDIKGWPGRERNRRFLDKVESLTRRVYLDVAMGKIDVEMAKAEVTLLHKAESLKRRAVCKKTTKELKDSIKKRWSKMRVSLALSSPAIREDRILSNSSTWFDSTPSHLISDFEDLPKLNRTEKAKARKRYVKALAEIPLEKFSPFQFKERMYKGKPLHLPLSGERYLTSNDKTRLKQAAKDLQKEAKESYFQITSEMPVLGYLKRGNPGKKELDEALSKIEEKLETFSRKAKEMDKGLLLSFRPLVEELLKEEKGYCLVAEKARIEVERKESLKNWALLGAGVAAALPCFMTGPLGASVCLSAGMALGIVGYQEARVAAKESVGRVLTGKEFETLASLDEREREEFLAKLFLPLGAFGTTAVPARAAAKNIAKALNKNPKNKEAAEKIPNIKANAEADVKAIAEVDAEIARIQSKINKRKNMLTALAEYNAMSIPPIPATKINIKHFTDATKEEAKKLIQKLKKETNSSPDINIRYEDIKQFMAEDEIKLTRHAMSLDRGLDFAVKKLQYVLKRSNGAKLYHGSKSSSLLIFAENNPLGALKGFHHDKISTVKISDFDVAFFYSTEVSSAKTFIKRLVSSSEVSKGANKLIEEDFPVIYGIKPKQGKKIEPSPPDTTLPGKQGARVDVLLEGGVSSQEISSVFVPARKVKSVESMIKSLNHEITVSPIEPIEEAFK